MGPLAQVGLALATSIGAWINLSLLAYFARRQGFAVSGTAIGRPVVELVAIGVVFAAALFAGAYGLQQALAGLTHFRDEAALALLVLLGAGLYFLLVYLVLGRRWFSGLLKEVSTAADSPAPVNLEQQDPTGDSEALPDSEPAPKG
jgi:putative peptidoglycan lipid II flippase